MQQCHNRVTVISRVEVRITESGGRIVLFARKKYIPVTCTDDICVIL